MTVRGKRSAGNVFRDLGFGAEEAENLKVRADLMIALTKLIEEQKLTQAAAARLFGVSQPRVSDLTRGKIDRFSVDSLIAMAGRAGARVSVAVTRPRAGRLVPARPRARKLGLRPVAKRPGALKRFLETRD